MTTAAERLKQLSGMAGATAAAMLLAIAVGATAGQALQNYSQLPTGTATQHLLSEPSVAEFPPGASKAWALPAVLRHALAQKVSHDWPLPGADRHTVAPLVCRHLAQPSKEPVVALAPARRDFHFEKT